jgi:hypothetical protein
VGKQEKKIHALPNQRTAGWLLADGIGIVMEVNLRNDGRQPVFHGVPENFKIEAEKALFGFRAERGDEAFV